VSRGSSPVAFQAFHWGVMTPHAHSSIRIELEKYSDLITCGYFSLITVVSAPKTGFMPLELSRELYTCFTG
jgi:hypothetical protein